ncbi:signal peptidase II [Acetivibrio cellulolyticus]|uniref:signal peptidase II n=1 Tax=Acetivibrio cellulolyticus TaxID=35830 RepID=UPI0004749990|nr:signal peptidase II [Acetivibrio cellulolyticus]
MIWAAIIIAIIGFDQFTKYMVINSIGFGERIPIIDGFFYLAHWQNTGAAWGIMQNGKVFLIPVTVIVSIALVYFMSKSKNKMFKASISMILGGALGNLIDRAFRKGGVVDFLDFHFGTYNFPTFNVADSFIVIGTILLSIYILFVMKDEKVLSKE